MKDNIEEFAQQMSEEAVERLNYDGDDTNTGTSQEIANHAIGGGEAVDYRELMQRLKTKPIMRVNKKIGRNDPCPCGSGKKFKNCCLASGKYDQYTTDKKKVA